MSDLGFDFERIEIESASEKTKGRREFKHPHVPENSNDLEHSYRSLRLQAPIYSNRSQQANKMCNNATYRKQKSDMPLRPPLSFLD